VFRENATESGVEQSLRKLILGQSVG
jgi:hypothetical protein